MPQKSAILNIPGFGKIRCSKEELTPGKINGGRLVRRASGYYFQYILDIILDIKPKQELISDAPAVGIDPGFSSFNAL
jgi:hypothetical protein